MQEIKNLTDQELLALKDEIWYKMKMDHLTQHALKILINALYGALANKHFILANPDMAAGITSSGRFFVQLMAINIEKGLQDLLPNSKPYVVYGDTDSVYYQIKTFVERKFGQNPDPHNPEVVDWCDTFEKQIIQKIIQNTAEQYAEILNIYDANQIGVEREIIADAAVFVAKKKYYARALDIEGVRYDLNDPYIKIMGLEIAQSGTPPWVKTKLKEGIQVVLDKDMQGVRAWRDSVKVEFANQPITTISIIKGVNNLNYHLGDRGIPQGSKSAIVHNNFVKAHNLENEIELLKPGEKYLRCYLKEPNRFGSEIISFADDKIAKMIEQDGIFDYSKNFEKFFEAPLERMVGSLNYNIKDVPVFEEW